MPSPTPEQAFAALRRGGLIQNDPDLVKLFDLSTPDYVKRARAEKPALFHFDARTATPEAAEARLKEIGAGLSRRNFQAKCDALLAELREPPAASTTPATARKPAPSQPERFDARTAKPEEVEARLAELTRSTRRPALERRDGMMRNARTLAKLQDGR